MPSHITTNMAILDYYFKIEFQFKSGKWLSNKGSLRAVVQASHDVLLYNYVNYNILGEFIVLTPEFHQLTKAEILITRLRQELFEKSETYYGNENIGLEIKRDFCRPIDQLTPEVFDDKHSINWNINTPQELQFIPTHEVFKLFDDWIEFLKHVEIDAPKFI